MYKLSDGDWKKYKERIEDWQEEYVEILLKEYVAFLQTKEPASIKFRELEKRIKTDKRKPGLTFTNRNKESAVYDIVEYVRKGIVTQKELDYFSNDLRETVYIILNQEW